MDKKKKLQLFIVLAVLVLLFVNISIISGYILFTKYGSMTLSPGENYIVNIPFISAEKPEGFPMVCGTAEQSDGDPVEDVTVKIAYSADNTTILGENITNKDGKYCITLPEITSNRVYVVYLEYDNETFSEELTLGSNEYTLDFENNLNYSKGLDSYADLIGKIINEDARIENGRLEIILSYCENEKCNITSIIKEEKYSVNIEPQDTYNIPNSEFSYSWEIPSDAKLGKYKLYIKASFNAKDHTKTVYFYITE